MPHSPFAPLTCSFSPTLSCGCLCPKSSLRQWLRVWPLVKNVESKSYLSQLTLHLSIRTPTPPHPNMLLYPQGNALARASFPLRMHSLELREALGLLRLLSSHKKTISFIAEFLHLLRSCNYRRDLAFHIEESKSSCLKKRAGKTNFLQSSS